MIPLRISGLMIAMCALAAAAQNPTEFASVPLAFSSSHPNWLFGNERHLQPTSVGALFLDSAFAHGYRHGYDQGFHAADIDIHMGRLAQAITKRDLRLSRREYNSSFGNRTHFEQGYQAGFFAGYDDAFAGRDYRASERAKFAASGLLDALPPSRRQYFDDGFASGYASAHVKSVASEGMTLDYVEQYCREKLLGSHPAEYCSGFSRGFIFGSSVDSATQSTASAGSPR